MLFIIFPKILQKLLFNIWLRKLTKEIEAKLINIHSSILSQKKAHPRVGLSLYSLILINDL